MSERRCPICGNPVEPRETNPDFPFCSARCRLVDLGKWLGEEYRVPDRFREEEDRAPAPTTEEDE